MKILHSADWHLDSPLGGFSEEQAKVLRAELLKVPDRVAALCKSENCDLLLLAGDLFDGDYTKESLLAVQTALKEVGVPVFIAPGNHDFCRPDSPYITEDWPENVHIFKHAGMESVSLPELDCKLYGAGYEAMDCPGLLKDFQAHGSAAVLHPLLPRDHQSDPGVGAFLPCHGPHPQGRQLPCRRDPVCLARLPHGQRL